MSDMSIGDITEADANIEIPGVAGPDTPAPQPQAAPQAAPEAPVESPEAPQPPAQPVDPGRIEVPTEAPEATEGETLDSLMAEAYDAWTPDGGLPPEFYERFAARGIPNTAVDNFIAGETARAQQSRDARNQLLVETAGGNIDTVVAAFQWAGTTLSQEQADALNDVLDNGSDADAIREMQSLLYQYNQAHPQVVANPTILRNPVAGTVVPFYNENEMVEAQRDKRYGHDDRYTAEVEERIKASMAAGTI